MTASSIVFGILLLIPNDIRMKTLRYVIKIFDLWAVQVFLLSNENA